MQRYASAQASYLWVIACQFCHVQVFPVFLFLQKHKQQIRQHIQKDGHSPSVNCSNAWSFCRPQTMGVLFFANGSKIFGVIVAMCRLIAREKIF